MTVPTNKTYPTNATNKTWQSKKTTGDKILTKTNLGTDLTDAEKAWKAIPWDDLDGSKATIASVEQARTKLHAAQLAENKVKLAEQALTKAYDTARVTAATKGLSKGTKTAADAAVQALDEAKTRLEQVNVTDFEHLVQQWTEPMKLNTLNVSSGGKTVATAPAATWDRRTLKAPRLVWTVGKADDYRNKKLVVSGKPDKTQNTEGYTDHWQNDMKLKSGSSNEFESYH
jgi:hypothetical protein